MSRFISALKLSELAAAPASPASGSTALYFKSDGKLYRKNSAGTETEIGAGGGGSSIIPIQPNEPAGQQNGELWWDDDDESGSTGWISDFYTLSNEYSSNPPATPATGVTIFARHKARRLLSMVGPAGLDTPVQPGLFNNRIARWQCTNNSATIHLEGWNVTNVVAPTAVALAATPFYASMCRARFSTTATAANANGVRSANAQWFTSTTANMGGMFMVTRFGMNSIPANGRFFCGFSSTTGALAAGTEPSALLNLFGLALDSTDTNFQIIHNSGSGAATKIDAGANFPGKTAAADFYEFRIFIPSGGGNTPVFMSLERLNTGQLTNFSIASPGKMPANNTLLSYHFNIVNNTAVVASADVQSIYIENDN